VHVDSFLGRTGRQLWEPLRLMVVLVALLWFVEVADQILKESAANYSLDSLGITPRTIRGLLGILFAPFVHSGFWHLWNNTLPLIFLGWIVMLGGRLLFVRVSAIIILAAGVGTWLFGTAPGPHLGSSTLIYGYLGFLLLRGFLEPSIRWVIVSVVIGVLYSGALGGFLPRSQISVVGHIFGFLGGLGASWLLFYLPKLREQKGRTLSPATPPTTRQQT